MKKALWITAVVVVISLICTVCFGVALGSQGVREVLREGGVLDELSENVNWHELIAYGKEWSDIIHDEIHDEQFLFDSKTLELPARDTLKITAEVGEVHVVRGSGDTVRAVLEQFSARANPTSRFTLSSVSETELRLSAEPTLNGFSARLTVYVPAALKELNVEVETGEAEIEDITADTLTVKVSTGQAEIKRVTAKNAELRVDTGNAEIGSNVRVTDTLYVHCACGEVELDMPVGGAKAVQYSVDTGNVDIDSSVRADWLHSDVRKGASQEGTLSYTRQDTAANGTYQIDVAIGNIQFDAESD